MGQRTFIGAIGVSAIAITTAGVKFLTFDEAAARSKYQAERQEMVRMMAESGVRRYADCIGAGYCNGIYVLRDQMRVAEAEMQRDPSLGPRLETAGDEASGWGLTAVLAIIVAFLARPSSARIEAPQVETEAAKRLRQHEDLVRQKYAAQLEKLSKPPHFAMLYATGVMASMGGAMAFHVFQSLGHSIWIYLIFGLCVGFAPGVALRSIAIYINKKSHDYRRVEASMQQELRDLKRPASHQVN